MRIDKLFLIAAALLAGSAFATPIIGTSGAGAPTVPGATSTIDFDSQGNTSFGGLTLGGVTFSGIGGDLRTSNLFAGQYNGRGTFYLDNNEGYTNGIRFDFAHTANAFAFNWGASDAAWTLQAFDSANHLIESFGPADTWGSNAGDYIGMANAGMKYAILSVDSNDWVFVDNFTVAQQAAAVPEPASLALFGAAIGAAGLARRRKAKAAA